MNSSSSRSHLILLIGRFLVGYLIFKTFQQQPIEMASVSDKQSSEFCSLEIAQKTLNQTEKVETSVNKLAWDLYNQCNTEFLSKNHLSPKVKQTVDEWLGIDLSKASANQWFWALQLALSSPKPEKSDPEFKKDCKRMVESYDDYLKFTSIVAPYIQINEGKGEEVENASEISNDKKDILNYAQYSQFCEIMLD